MHRENKFHKQLHHNNKGINFYLLQPDVWGVMLFTQLYLFNDCKYTALLCARRSATEFFFNGFEIYEELGKSEKIGNLL